MPLNLRPLHPDLGVEITGCHLNDGVSDTDFAVIRQALADHGVVAMPGQHLTPASQKTFLERFGKPKISQRKEFHIPGVPEIGKVGNTRHPDGSPAAFLDRDGNLWHSDTASDEHVDAVTMLACVLSPSQGGDTKFCSMVAAYASLPADLRQALEGRQVVHNFNQHNDFLLARNPGSAKPLTPQERAKWGDKVHDLVQYHPVTGKPLYFLSPTLVKSISGYTAEESEALAERLIAHATREGHVFSYRWNAGDLVFWDNRAVMHSASPADYGGSSRLMHRGYAYIDLHEAANDGARIGTAA